jgi:hypothetical protein
MSFHTNKFKHELNITWRDCHRATPEELEILYATSNPRERRFITAWKNRNKPVVESASQFRAKNINRAMGSLSFALRGIKGLGSTMQGYAHNSKPQSARENVKINMAGIELRRIEYEISVAIRNLQEIQRNAALGLASERKAKAEGGS